ncbi:hypothetical protein PN4B1_42600 [Paenibacillus naphthalenovorans]|uniref:S-layer homology domain-containing protein n=2 Tax=Paenibacillus naphthalenovorans TaxID=162209 RepID=UPI00088964F7|nr:S-layer homology domain-containing protein [Paenibacillus naphthalenovorans]GCL74314.1 hypothetical protein PN4B1_42600 [Paenibacillus naphthalenovorans]SDJ16883.1 S-layer homology domain-containing protein [Paenibacillus naphthalenovorans]
MYKSLSVFTMASTIAMSLVYPMALANAASPSDTSSGYSHPQVKTSEHFKDLDSIEADTRKIVDFMLAQGYVEGMSDYHFGLADRLTRVQAAKIATKLFGIPVDSSVQKSTFTDVSAQSPEHAWGIPYIEAAKQASLIEGVDQARFDPDGSITLGQLAAILVRGLGIKAAPTGPNEAWYTGYMQAAQTQGIDFGGKAGDEAATREDFIKASYQAHQAYQLQLNAAEAGKVSVVSAEATDYNKVKVQLNRQVDPDTATLVLTKDGVEVAATVAYTEGHPSAVLTLKEGKLTAGRYKVTLGGLREEDVEQIEAEFTADNETVTSIEFVTESEMLAKSRYASIRLKAINQYGQKASFSPASFSYTVNDSSALHPRLDKTPDGDLRLTLDTLTYHLNSRSTLIQVNLRHNDTNIAVQKSFTIGAEPVVTTLKAGEVSYSDSRTAIKTKGQKAVFDLIPYDQYGNVLGFNALREALQAGQGTANLKDAVSLHFHPGTANFRYDIVDERGDDTIQAHVTLIEDILLAADYTASVYVQGGSASVTIAVQAYAKAVSIEFGDMNKVIANGDTNVYIPVTAYDESGAKLSLEDLTSDAFADRVRITVIGAQADRRDGSLGTGAVIEKAGKNKGSIWLTSITAPANGKIRLTADIMDQGKTASFFREYAVQNARIPAGFKEVKAPASEIVPGSYTKFTYTVVDQYGEELDAANNVAMGKIVASGGDVYSIRLDPGSTFTDTVTETTYGLTLDKDPAKGHANRPAFEYTGAEFETFNDGFRFYAPPGQEGGSYTFSAQLLKNGTEISRATRTVQIKRANDLTYSLDAVPALYRPGSIVPAAYQDAHLDPAQSLFARKLSFTIKNARGEQIYFVNGFSQSAAASDTQIVKTAVKNGNVYVLGSKAGKTNISVVYTTVKNEQKIANVEVNVKDDPLSVSSFTADNETAVLTLPSGGSVTENVYTLMGLSFKDNYGIGYKGSNTVNYNYAFGNSFGVDYIKPMNPGAPLGTVSIDAEGRVTVTGNVGRFDLIAYKGSSAEVRTRVTVVTAP